MTMLERIARSILAATYHGGWDAAHEEGPGGGNREDALVAARSAMQTLHDHISDAMIHAGHERTADPCWPEDYVKAWRASLAVALSEDKRGVPLIDAHPPPE